MIGIFDSGSGGLTVLKAIRERMPSSDFLYFGDIKNAPYGTKTQSELSALTFANFHKLVEIGATSIVSACNSASTALAVSLLDTENISPDRVIEMVGPTVRALKHTDVPILLAATPATIESGAYQNAFSMIGKEIKTLAFPDLGRAIEFGASEAEIEQIIRSGFEQIPKGSFRILVLACTHYPLVLSVFKRVLGEDVLIFDPADAVAERVEKQWFPREAANGSIKFLISKDSPTFRGFVKEFFPKDADKIEVIE